MAPPSWAPRAVGVEASYLPGALLLPQITLKAPRSLLCESREGKSPASFLLLPTAPVPTVPPQVSYSLLQISAALSVKWSQYILLPNRGRCHMKNTRPLSSCGLLAFLIPFVSLPLPGG